MWKNREIHNSTMDSRSAMLRAQNHIKQCSNRTEKTVASWNLHQLKTSKGLCRSHRSNISSSGSGEKNTSENREPATKEDDKDAEEPEKCNKI